MKLTELSIDQLQKLYLSGEVKPEDVVKAYLSVIDSVNKDISAVLKVYSEDALKRARELEKADPGQKPLYGVPVAVKDNICEKGRVTSCASRILEGYRPPYDATAVRRLSDAGAVIIGKTNMDEFAMGSSTENSAFGNTANPWNRDYAPGGSSGGSAAAVAAGMVPVALGSDTGGSIRQPASLCGVVGLKGTYGRVSRYGLVAFASSLDQIGPITRTVGDCAIAMEVISGHDQRDATTLRQKSIDLKGELDRGVKGLRIAVPAELGKWEIAPELTGIMDNTVESLEELGAEVKPAQLPDMDVSIACYYVLANAEASSNLARYDGVRYGLREEAEDLIGMYEKTRGRGFGEEVKRRVLLGTYVLSAGYYDAYYRKAQSVRAMIRKKYEELFEAFDLVLLPTAPGPAFRLGEKIDDPIAMYLSDIFTTTANIAGLPAISVPAGLAENGLPLGMQLMAGHAMEGKLMRGASALESLYRFEEKAGKAR